MIAVVTAVGFVAAAALGAVARWWASVRRHRRWHDHLPLPTLTVNVLGAFTLGCLAGSDPAHQAATLAGTGFLGAFTTFSTFVRESHALTVAGDRGRALIYVGLSLGGGTAAALAGLALTS